MTNAAGDGHRTQSNVYKDKSKPQDVRSSNMTAAKGTYHRLLFTVITFTSIIFKRI